MIFLKLKLLISRVNNSQRQSLSCTKLSLYNDRNMYQYFIAPLEHFFVNYSNEMYIWKGFFFV